MKNNSLKKTGFTLVEIVISISIISIISVGVYGAYLLIIKNTKLAEERQSIALVGKRTIEDVKDSIENDKVVFAGSNIIINDLNLLKSEDVSKSKDGLTMSEKEGKFTAKLYFDSKYNICEEADPNCVYEEELIIEKAKATKEKEAGEGKGESEAEKDIDMDIDVNEDKTEEDADIINKTINNIENEYSMAKEEGDNNSKINGNEISYDDKEKALILNVFIEQKGDSIETVIKDNELNILEDPILQSLDTTDDINHLNLHFNFKEYKKEKKEKLKDLKINVYNRVEDSNKVKVNLYIEKSVDLNVVTKAKSNRTINIFNRGDDKKIIKVGPLYNINVRIALKGELASKDNSKIFFTGYTNKNINIKQNT